ncbi:Cationic amino acid transporter 1 [Daldinia childiae]|uniref:Cationic amino acid transporter 1 n=2 Tax=Daldinia childiae TaxID=326645 RepID=UPI001445F13A|nr:Cationic amino acid transporter 1 [Daldinia childiae]KAF3064618.1 Cationic amino acid transporter 1 [Daldinia childiae]
MAGDDSPSPSAVYNGSEDLHDKNPSFAGDPYIDDDGDHGADTELKRSLSTRHLTMIALGSSIGMGLWLGSGTSLANGGPAGIFLGYCLAGSMIWCVSHSIGEMACVYPLPSAFVQWTGKFVDPAAAFALGWSYWFSYCITIANELASANTVITYWTTRVPIAGWISIWLVIIILINIGAVTLFGEIEVVASTIKFGWIFVVIISMIVMSAGGAGYDAVGFRYWNEMPFTHGFKGFLAVMPTCIFAMSGSENSGLVAAETANPKKSIPRAVGSIWLRLALFYLVGSLMVTINVNPNNDRLFGANGASGTGSSPFVIAYSDAGIPVLAHMMNAVILISVVSTGSISGYGGSRTAMGLAYLNMAPKVFTKADKIGRPWWGLVPTFVLGGGLAYLNVSESGVNVFTWFSNLTSLFTLFGWGMICLSHIRFRHAWARQGRTAEELPWKSWIYPVGPWWGLTMCILLIIVQFYLAVWPLDHEQGPTTFFANYISVIVIVVLWLGARAYYRGRWWVNLDHIVLDEGRRFYKNDVEKAKPTGVKGYAKRAVSAVFS